MQLSDVKAGNLAAASIKAKVLSYQQYYPFGWAMPGRSVNPERSRFGFNNMEKNTEIDGGNYDFGARAYDGRIGKWWSVDPEKAMYPNQSPYNFALNSPIKFLDKNGGYVVDENGNIIFVATGTPEFFTHDIRNGSQTVDEAREKINNGSSTSEKVETYGYYGTRGYVFADDGTKIEVVLVTDENVYNAVETHTNKPSEEYEGVMVPNMTREVDKKNPRTTNDASPNCTGHCLLGEKLVAYTGKGFKAGADLLKHDKYSEEKGTPQKGDIGVYYQGADIVHFELYESDKSVETKGGVTIKETGQTPGTTYPESNGYKVFRKNTPDNRKTKTNLGQVNSNGVRVLTSKEGNEVKKQINQEIKADKKKG